MLKEKYNDKKISNIKQKKLNYFLRKKIRYERLGMTDKVEECNAFICLYKGQFLDFMDYILKINNQEKNNYYKVICYLLNELIIKNEANNTDDINTIIKTLQKKCLFDLTEEEAKLLGGKTYIEYTSYQTKLCDFLSSKIKKTEIIECETLRDLLNTCAYYIKK